MSQRQQPRLFFCHVPKTAGLTLRRILGSHFHHREIFPYDRWDRVPEAFPAHDLVKYRLFHGHLFWSSTVSLLGQPLTTITMLRHPIERILSSYHHVQSNPAHPLHARIGGKSANLNDFLTRAFPADFVNTQVLYLSGTPVPETTLLQEAEYSRMVILNPQQYLNLEHAKQVLEQMTAFGIAERFDESLPLLLHALGWEPVRTYESLNVSVDRQRVGDIDPVTLERLYEYNRLDLDLYEYAVSLFETRSQQLTQTLYWDSYNYRSRTQPAAREIMISAEDAMESDGWYPREFTADGRCFRWLGPGTSGRLFVRLVPSDQMEFSAALFHAVTPELVSLLRVKINRHELKLTAYFDAEQQATILTAYFEGRLIETADVITVIEFSVPYTLSAHERDAASPDKRRLSIAIRWVKISARSV